MGFQVSRMRRDTFAYPYPGKSTREIFSFTRKKLIVWVLPGLELVLARFFRLTSALIKEDFPTFDLPAMAISGKFSGGYSEGLVALLMNSADMTLMALGLP